MLSYTAALSLTELKSAIIRNPLVVSRDTPVMEAIAKMNALHSHCAVLSTVDSQSDEIHWVARSSCVFVVDDGQIVGLLTERDVVHLTAQQRVFDHLEIQQVMTHPVATLRESAFNTLQSATDLLQKNRTRHLPILDEQNYPVGLVTCDSLQQAITRHQLNAELRARQAAESRLQESEQRYASLVAAAPVGIFRANAAGRCIYVNEQYCQMVGSPPEDSMGEGWQSKLHPDDVARVVAKWEESVRTAQPCQLECRCQSSDGTCTYKWVYVQAVPEYNPQGRVVGYVGTLTDISDRKRSEDLLRQSEAHQRALISALPDLIARINREGIYLEFVANPNFQVMGPLSEIVGTHVSESLPRSLAQRRLECIQQALQTRSIQIYEQDLSFDGKPQIEEVRVVPYSEDEALLLIRDISDRKQAEFALKQSELTNRTIIEALPDLLIQMNLEGHQSLMLGGSAVHVKYPTESLNGPEVYNVLPHNLADQRLHYARQAIKSGNLQIYEQIFDFDGDRRHEEVRIAPLNNQEVLVIIRDITDRKRSEAALEEREQRFRQLFEATPKIAVQGYDRHRRVIYWNDASEKLYGYTQAEAMGELLEDLIIPLEMRQEVIRLIGAWLVDEQPIPASELSLIRKDGSRVAVFSSHIMLKNTAGEPEMYCVDVDLSELKQAEAALHNLIQGTAATTGQDFFPALASHIAEALHVSYAIVTEKVGEELTTLAFWANGALSPLFSYHPAKTPCEIVLGEGHFYQATSLQQAFPEDLDLVEMNADSYLGIALRDTQDNVIGNLCILHQQPLQDPKRAEQILRVFAARAAAELERQRALTSLEQANQALEAKVEERTAELRSIIRAIPDLLLRVRRDGTCLDYIQSRNQAGEFLPIKQHLSEVLPPALLQQQLNRIDQAIATDTLQIYEHQFEKRGREVYEEVRISATGPDEVLIIVRDITHRKRAENALLESQQFVQTVLDTVPIPVFWKDRDSIFLGCNQPLVEVLGLQSTAEIIGKSDFNCSSVKAEASAYHADDQWIMESGKAKLGIEEVLTLPNGRQRWLETHKAPLRDWAGNIVGLVGTFQDITERKQAEERLLKSEAALAEAQRVAHVGNWEFDIQSQKITWSKELFCMFGLDPTQPEPTYEEYLQLIYSDDRELLQQSITQAISEGVPYTTDYRIIHTDGCLRYHEGRAEIERDDQGRIVRLFGTALDITDRKQVEAELEASRAYYEGMIADQTELICRYLPDGTLTFVNKAYCKFFQKSPEELLGQSFIYFLPEEDQLLFLQKIDSLSVENPVVTYEHRVFAPEGTIAWQQWTDRALFDPEGHFIEFQAVGRDVTALKEAETRVLSLLNRTQLLHRISSEIRESLDLDRILQNSVNAVLAGLPADICTFAWYQKEDDSNIWAVVKEQKKPELPSWLGTHQIDEFSTLLEHILQNQIQRVNNLERLEDESFRAFLEQAKIAVYLCLPIHTVGDKIGSLQIGRISYEQPWQDEEIELLKDIGNQVAIAIHQAQLYEESQAKTKELQRSYHDLQETQLQLIQSEKMSSLGQLVAGIAHEINNPMSFIYGNLEPALEYTQDLAKLIRLYQETYPNPPQAIARFTKKAEIEHILSDFPKLLSSMETGATRIRDIIQSLRTFSRLDRVDCKPVNLHENIDSTLVILQNRLNGRAGKPEIQVVKDYGDLPPIECYGSLLNQVFMNLLVNAIDAIEEHQTKTHPEYSGCIKITTRVIPGNKVTISIQDNGSGIDLETQAKIFNPFFTTKPIGVGTGMGLPISYQIVTGNHQGQLHCYSTLNHNSLDSFSVTYEESRPSL